MGPLPTADRYEPNDGAGSAAWTLWGRAREIRATLDYWDDPIDVYRIKLAAGQRLSASLRGPAGSDSELMLWRPGTERVDGLSPQLQANRLTLSSRPGQNQYLSYRALSDGWYYLEAKLTAPGSGPYTLTYAKRS